MTVDRRKRDRPAALVLTIHDLSHSLWISAKQLQYRVRQLPMYFRTVTVVTLLARGQPVFDNTQTVVPKSYQGHLVQSNRTDVSR